MVKHPTQPILLIDDEEQFLISVTLTLKSVSINNVYSCSDSRKVMNLLAEQKYSLILLDMIMPYVSGNELVHKIIKDYPQIPLIIITAINDAETAVECMKAGAFDYVLKPVDTSRLVTAIKRAIELREVRQENKLLRQYLLTDKLTYPDAFMDIVTNNSAMRSVFKYTEAIAKTALPVLITGETGVGKELIARAIHMVSERKGDFVTVNVAGLDDNLFSDTLFGHKKGAFTGAEDNRKGLIEQAFNGTLFLDEIGDLSLESQVKLLRLLQEGKYYPLGSDTFKVSDARVVVATNQNLEQMQEKGRFRRDLYYRLKTHNVIIPPLRERNDDVPLLVEHFLEKAADQLRRRKPTCPRELYTLLKTYHFPGNIRELEGMIFDVVSQHESGGLSLDTFKKRIGLTPQSSFQSNIGKVAISKEMKKRVTFSDKLPSMKELEQVLIEEALSRAEGNQTIAAQLIGMSRKALNNRLLRSRK